MRPVRRDIPNRQAGFTLIESLIVVAVVGILILISAPAMMKMLNRFKLSGTTRELASLMQATRLESIKMSAPAEVNYDAALNAFFAFVDLDRDGAVSAPDHVLPGRVIVPRKVDFWGPTDAAANGANATDGWDDAPANLGPIYSPDGSVDRTGAFRLKDSNDNFLEVRVMTPATGRIVLRKWDRTDAKFYENGENGHKWEWY